MEGIQLNEEQDTSLASAVSEQSFLIRLVLKTGMVATERGAQMLLLGVAVAGILIALFVAFSGGVSNTPPLAPSITGEPVSATQ